MRKGAHFISTTLILHGVPMRYGCLQDDATAGRVLELFLASLKKQDTTHAVALVDSGSQNYKVIDCCVPDGQGHYEVHCCFNGPRIAQFASELVSENSMEDCALLRDAFYAILNT